ncbi:HAD family hydrolase [Labrys okinawensis]|uniref:HAD family hydrolase n=1 Tax=Labrys okinawensis TaxID=346911 RepID=UPI0039BC772E
MLEPLAGFPLDARRAVQVVLTDIDDTLTDHGRLPPVAYEAMARLAEAGITVVPVTGRPAGWCDLIARQWPVAGVVGENGAFYFRYDDASRTMIRHYARDRTERHVDREKLEAVRRTVLAEVPGAAVSADQAYREADLAIDFCEDVPRLLPSAIGRIVEIFAQAGATAKVSSIHVNGWFGHYDKLTTSKVFLADVLGVDVDRTPVAVAYIGDSPNDMPMFGFFANSVGVANVLDFRDQLSAPPRWVTSRRGSRGFAEFAEALIGARAQ